MKLPCPASDLALPHREPFLFVDTVTELECGVRARGEVQFSRDLPMFAGHFPGEPLIPGVVLAEAIAQLSGIAAATARRSFLLSAIRSMKFPAPARPEERIFLQAMVVADHGGLVQCEGAARVGERIVAEGSVVLSERQKK